MTRMPLVLLSATLLSVYAHGQSLREMFKKVSPAVVVIRTVEKDLSPDAGEGFVNSPGLGSGFLVSADGKVITAAHVVQTADVVGVEFMDGTIVPSRVIASSVRGDVALLQLEYVPRGAVIARLGDSDKMEPGDDVFIIGAPYGISHSLTVGHISGRRVEPEVIGGVAKMELLQTDAAINQGNSGGPMFNKAGEVVGVVSHILSQSGGFEGLGFVVTSNVARQLLLGEQSFWSGADIVPLGENLARILNVPQSAGLLVQRVAAGSPAASIGLKGGAVRALLNDEELIVGGDIILAVAGIELKPGAESINAIQHVLSKAQPGDLVTMSVLRGGMVVELRDVVGRR